MSQVYLIADLVVGKEGGSIITASIPVHTMRRICARDLPCNSKLPENQ
jgi:hypothetical protein